MMGSDGRINRGIKRGYLGDVRQNHASANYQENRLPHGWLDCPAYGDEVCDFIIPSKVPLDESYNQYITSGKTYTPKQVIRQQKLVGRHLGLVIDLTNTNRYYPKSDWIVEGINYVKINCKGRDEVPDHASVQKFIDEVLQFCSQQSRSKKYILVHCTHGHNRTGFMIVHYLVRKESLSVTEAIDKFARARPPGIYKDDYIDALYAFYQETRPEGIGGLPTPEWKRSYLYLNSEAVPNQVDERDNYLQEDHARTELMTHDSVLGEVIRVDLQKTLQQVCYQLLKLDVGPKANFPGSHPVSLDRDNLQLLRQHYYYATWKADGTRYMMLITSDGCYLIDRRFIFRKVEMRFPCRLTNEGIAEQTHHYTLLDGEMIIDTDKSTGKQERRYLIYDLIAINQESVVELPFNQRWAMIEREVIQPRKLEMCSKTIHLYYNYDMETFTVRRKNFWLLSTASKLLTKFIPQLSHEADGLILQGWDDPYVPRTHEGLLKWKFPEMNSVDFLFEMGNDNRPQLFLFERGRKKIMGGKRVKFEGKIIECSWDPEENVWVCMRIRTDKSTPNELNTYNKVMRSIRDNITEDVLLNKINEIISLPMYADRTQYDIKAHQRTRRK